MANKQSTSSPPEPALLTIEKGPAELREIVLFIDGRTGTSGIVEFAGMLAKEHGARLISVFKQTSTHRELSGDVHRVETLVHSLLPVNSGVVAYCFQGIPSSASFKNILRPSVVSRVRSQADNS